MVYSVMAASRPSHMFATVAAFALGTVAATSNAQVRRGPAPGTVQGATKVHQVDPPRGFVDDPMAFDGAGGRLLYVNTDAGNLVNLEVIDLAQGGAPLATVDLSEVAPLPDEVHLAPGGDRFVVIYRTSADKRASKAAVLIDGAGKVVRRFGPALDVAYTRYDGTPAVVSYTRTDKRGRKGLRVLHTVEARALATGKRLGKKVTLEADDTGHVERLGFRIQYWRDGYTRAHGIKEGTWDRKEDQRSPDKYAVYDVPARTFSRVEAIGNLVKHAEDTAVYREFSAARFARVPRDRSGVVVYDEGGARPLQFAEPFSHYLPESLAYQAVANGGMYVSLTIDPVHPDAVARKKADDPWVDLYYVAPGQTKAKRVARLMAGKRGIHWRASATHWAVLDKHVGFSRGGKSLTLYRLKR